MEAAVIVLALLVGGLLVTRASAAPRVSRPADTTWLLDAPLAPPASLPVEPTSAMRRPPLRVFAADPLEAPSGRDYTLTLARTPSGQWQSVLRAPERVPDGGVLTVTLVVPWSDIASRYSAVNLVVR